jgi:subtilisin family serine protease
MPTPQERVASAVRFFFERALPEATSKTFAQLTSPRVHVGAYVPYSGAPVATSFGQSLTPRFALRVSPAVPVANGQPNPGTVTAPDNAPMRHLMWLRHVADPVADDEAEIRRVIADFDSTEALFTAPNAPAGDDAGGTGTADAGGGGATGGGGTTGGAGTGESATATAAARAVEWARGIKAAAASLPADLTALTAVPEPLRAVAPDVEALKQVLLHFFTYRATGVRYARWAGAGRDASNPAHLTTDYKQENVREVVLERERLYVYAVVPQSLFAGGSVDPSSFREAIIRFDETSTEQRPFTLATVHTTQWRRTAAPHEDFVFFYTQAGAGIQYPLELQQKMSARLIAFLGQVEDAGDARTRVFQAATHVLTEQAEPELRLVALMDPPQTPLPAFAVGDTTGAARNVQVPLARLAEFVALPPVRHVDVVPPMKAAADLSRAAVQYPTLDAKIAVAKRGGQGVVVGIIDSGIDGRHPAFAGRIHSYWDQTSPANAVLTGKSPKKNNLTNAAYDGMDFGIEVTRTSTPHSVTNAQDPNGHGTHVAGTAAGAEVRDAAGAVTVPAGFAPRATIVAVRAIATDQQDYLAATRYIFQKATELSMPCVINMSFGQHWHAHDGSDPSSRALFALLTDANKNYKPGRVVIAAAGNERNNDMHIRRRVTGDGKWRIGKLRIGAGLGQVGLNIWVKNPRQTCPVSFPLDIFLYRNTTPPSLSTRAVRLGSSTTAANPAGSFPTVRTKIGIESSLSDVVNGDFNFQVTFETTQWPQPATGTTPAVPGLAMATAEWAVVMINASGQPLDVHMWIPNEDGTVFTDMIPADYQYMMGSPAASAAAISVAASNTRLTWTPHGGGAGGTSAGVVGDIALFSSPGPLRASSIPPSQFYGGVTHEINGVDVTAPGCRISAAYSSQSPLDPTDMLSPQAILMQGTSMASPAVTGLIANIMAETPGLTLPQALTLLKNASTIPAATTFHKPAATAGSKPLSRDWGYGLVNAGLLKP